MWLLTLTVPYPTLGMFRVVRVYATNACRVAQRSNFQGYRFDLYDNCVYWFAIPLLGMCRIWSPCTTRQLVVSSAGKSNASVDVILLSHQNSRLCRTGCVPRNFVTQS
ncbi:hypothetical protein CSKR_201179 [Clonorchis sinensis]|uniref:Uncharacterized protein n=1 Tax=Clonorchis sinensis TaxID=79923 RepID=A0A8T1MMQ4_CLOSI|nr:hypothetical protein CSKR_201179 [Clonorchis sinensis]